MLVKGAGTEICLDFEVRDCNDDLDTASSVSFVVRKPDCTTHVLTPASTGTGTYTVSVPTASGEEGQWWYGIVTTDPDTEADGSFLITPALV